MIGHLMLRVAQDSFSAEEAMPAMSATTLAIVLACVVVMLIALWKVFEKAGQPGWTAIVPFVNLFFYAKAAGKPAWWGILLFVPLVGIVVYFMLSIDLAKRFGRSALFGVGLVLLPFIFLPILAFSDSNPIPQPA